MSIDKLRRLDLNLLVCLHALLEEQSASRAAERLHLSQSAISKSLSRLRTMFEDPLFIRSARGLIPTSRAEALAEPLQQILQSLADLIEPSSFDPQYSSRSFTIACIDSAYHLFLPSYFAPLLEAAPNLELNFPIWNQNSPRLLEQGKVDLAVTIFENTPDSLHSLRDMPSGIRHMDLTDDHQVCLVRDNHPILKKKSWNLATFLTLPHVQASCEGKGRWMLDQALEKQKLKRRIVARVPEFQAALSITCHSDLIFTAPSLFGRLAERRYPLAMLELPLQLPPVTYMLLWHQRFDNDPGHRWLREHLYQHIIEDLPGS